MLKTASLSLSEVGLVLEEPFIEISLLLFHLPDIIRKPGTPLFYYANFNIILIYEQALDFIGASAFFSES